MNMNQLAENLFEAMENSGEFFFLKDCGFCHFPNGWFIHADKLFYDPGCYCTGQQPGQNLEPRDKKAFIESYLSQQVIRDRAEAFIVQYGLQIPDNDIEHEHPAKDPCETGPDL